MQQHGKQQVMLALYFTSRPPGYAAADQSAGVTAVSLFFCFLPGLFVTSSLNSRGKQK